MFINKVTINIKYLNCCVHNFYRINIRYVSDKTKIFEEKRFRKQLLQNYLGLSYLQSAAFLRNNSYLQNIEGLNLEFTLEALQKMDIKKEDIIKDPMTLTLHHNTIEHNVMYLREAGFKNVSAQSLLRFRSVVKKPVALLKAHGVISEDVNVQHKLFSNLNPKPLQFPLLDQFNEEDSIAHMHAEIFKYYLVWCLDTSEQEINRIFKTYDNFKYRSFKLMSEMIRLLIKELKFSKQKLLQQSYLFQVNPQYPIQILKLFPLIADTDIKHILRRFPKIIAVSPESIEKIIKHLKNSDVPDESLKNCFEIFTLSPDTILHRLNEIKKTPELEAFKNNKRFVRLVFNYNKAKLRLDHLQKLKVKNASINFLVSSDNLFEKFALDGYDTNRGVDVINCLMGKFNMPGSELRKLFNHNPHWCQVPLINILDSLKYLTSMMFSLDEIGKLPVILLYTRNVIKEAFSEMEVHPEIYKLVLNHREQLHLCLYFIEKKYHFSGDGVWNNKTLIKSETNNENAEDLLVEEPKDIEEIKKQNLC